MFTFEFCAAAGLAGLVWYGYFQRMSSYRLWAATALVIAAFFAFLAASIEIARRWMKLGKEWDIIQMVLDAGLVILMVPSLILLFTDHS